MPPHCRGSIFISVNKNCAAPVLAADDVRQLYIVSFVHIYQVI